MESGAASRANGLCRRHLDPMPECITALAEYFKKYNSKTRTKKTNCVKNVMMLKAGGACGSRLTARIYQSK